MIYVVFADADAKRELDEDLICTTRGEMKDHIADLRHMGCEPVWKEYANEQVFYAAKERLN